MGYGYSPFDPGFGGFNFEDPNEEERKRRELEEAEATSLRQAMDTEPSWDDPAPDVSGRLQDVEPTEKSRGPVTDDNFRNEVGRELIVKTDGEKPEYLDALAEHLEARPSREDYEPSTLRKILSVVGGTLAGGNPDVTRMLSGMDKYDEAMGDWGARGEGLGDVATLEEKHMGSRRDLEEARIGAGTDLLGQDVDLTESQQDYDVGMEGAEVDRERIEQERAEAEAIAGLRERELAPKIESAAARTAMADAYGRKVDQGPNRTVPGPAAQKTAQSTAMRTVLLQPGNREKYKMFIQTDPTSGKSKLKIPKREDFDQWFKLAGGEEQDYQNALAAYQELMKEVEQEANSMLYGAQPSGPGDVPPFQMDMGY
jgi:hypothetical protein